MRRLRIDHVTTYRYLSAVTLLPHRLLLRPREGHAVRLESAELTIAPAATLHWQRDVYDNALAVVNFYELTDFLSISSSTVLLHYQDRPLDFLVADYALYFAFQYSAAEQGDLLAYRAPIFPQDQPALAAWLGRFWQPGQVVETFMLLDWINKDIATGFTYEQREAPGVQMPALTLATRRGSCRDFATLFIEACRYLGLAARFVSGYSHVSADSSLAGATHAWSEVYIPGAGWTGFDSTSGQVVGNQHIAVAVHRHPESIPPVAGAFSSATLGLPLMQVSVSVAELSV